MIEVLFVVVFAVALAFAALTLREDLR